VLNKQGDENCCFAFLHVWFSALLAAGQVSEQGDVLYVLPPNFKAIIRGRSWLMRLEPALEWAKSVAGYAVRVSFGTALVASVVVVSLTIVALLTAASSSDRDNDRRGHCTLHDHPPRPCAGKA
jgi:hypothetical protein